MAVAGGVTDSQWHPTLLAIGANPSAAGRAAFLAFHDTALPGGTVALHARLSGTPVDHSGHRDTDTRTKRRVLEATAFVSPWVAAGYLLPVTSHGYLLLGIPLTVAFQLCVRRRPLPELFVHASAGFSCDRRAVATAVVLVVVPSAFAVGPCAATNGQAPRGTRLLSWAPPARPSRFKRERC